jgi:hypothetical protein
MEKENAPDSLLRLNRQTAHVRKNLVLILAGKKKFRALCPGFRFVTSCFIFSGIGC